jgi:hypothetical protein
MPRRAMRGVMPRLRSQKDVAQLQVRGMQVIVDLGE